MTKERKSFVESIANYVKQYAPKYGIEVYSPIIGQAILESGWGESLLASKYHNYFGMKCGSKWSGPSVNMTTKEEYTPGTKTDIRANFRSYDSMREGVRGYFEFIQLPRYENLKGVTDPAEYLRLIKSDGYATATDYVPDVMKVVTTYNLTQYDPQEVTRMSITERDITLMGHGSGNPTLHNMYTYTAQRYAKKSPNGKHKGIIAVRRPKAITDAMRAKFGETLRPIIGRNLYSQPKREYVYKPYKNGNYYSDCGTAGMATLQRLGLTFGWLYNTAAIYTGKEFETVPVKIKDGHITNPELLRVGDAVLYIGNDPSRPLQIGHVEWVYDTPAEDKPVSKTDKAYSGTWPSLSNGRSGAQKKGFYQYGDGISALKNYPTQIRRLQIVLNWLDDSTKDIAVDGKFGKKTKAKVNTCRGMFGLQKNGLFDADLLARAKKYRKN